MQAIVSQFWCTLCNLLVYTWMNPNMPIWPGDNNLFHRNFWSFKIKFLFYIAKESRISESSPKREIVSKTHFCVETHPACGSWAIGQTELYALCNSKQGSMKTSVLNVLSHPRLVPHLQGNNTRKCWNLSLSISSNWNFIEIKLITTKYFNW